MLKYRIIVSILSILFTSTSAFSQAVTRFPIPRFEQESANAASARLETAFERVREHLCRRPTSITSDWQQALDRHLTELIVAEHAVIWVAAGEIQAEENTRIRAFYNSLTGLERYLVREARTNESLNLAVEKMREFTRTRTNLASKIDNRYGRSAMTLFALRLMLWEVNKAAANEILSAGDDREFVRLMNASVAELQQAHYFIYTRGLNNARQRLDSGREFPFSLDRATGDLEPMAAKAVIERAVSLIGAGGIAAEEVHNFDKNYSFASLGQIPNLMLGQTRLNELRGRCIQPVVKIMYHPSRKADADRAVKLLGESRYVVQEPIEGTFSAEHSGRIYYKNRGTQTGSEAISELLKQIEPLGSNRGQDTTGPNAVDYSVYIIEKPPKKNAIKITFVDKRRQQAEEAKRLLEERGYRVSTSVMLDTEANRRRYSNQIVYRPSRGGTDLEARQIASVVREIEALRPSGSIANVTTTEPAYNIFIVTTGEDMIDWNTNPAILKLVGKNYQQFVFTCEPNGTSTRTLWGTDIYTDDSPICLAAAHAGFITKAAGGRIRIEIRPGLSSYQGSTRNGIRSSNYGNWRGSFVVLGVAK